MTTAITPNAKNHEGLAGLASRFVSVTDLPWEDTNMEGIQIKTLVFDKASGLVTCLMKVEPGCGLPDHTHALIEQTYVLEGSLVCAEGECKAGDYVWRPSGSRHKAWCPDGGLMIAIFQVPNKFHKEQGEVDLVNQNWDENWANCTNMSTAR